MHVSILPNLSSHSGCHITLSRVLCPLVTFKLECKDYTIQFLIATAATAKSLQSYLTLCDPIDGSPLSSPVPGILQARTLEWVGISFSNA